MSIIHMTLDLLPLLNCLRLLSVLLPIVRASESDSQDFYISSDQLLHNEPQIIIENDNDQLLQESFDPSKLDELNAEDKDNLESIKSQVSKNPNHDSLDITSEEGIADNSLTADNNSTIQRIPNTVTLEELSNVSKVQPVRSELHSIPAHQYIQKDPNMLQQYKTVNNDEALFNQVYLNQQNVFDQTKNIKLPQLSTDPKTYWEFPSVEYPIPRDNYLSVPSFIEDYYPSYDDLLNLYSNTEHQNNLNNDWLNNNQGHDFLSNNPHNSTIQQLTNKLNPLRFWFDENSNHLTPHIYPQLQHYNYADSEISEIQSLSPNIYQNSYNSGNLIEGNKPNIYKPLDNEHFLELSQNKNSIPEPLNGKPFLNQYSNDKILRPRFEEYPDVTAPAVLLDYNRGNNYQNLQRDQVSELEPSPKVPLADDFVSEVAYYDPAAVGSVPQPAFYAQSIEPKEVSPLSLGKSSKSHAAFDVQINQRRNYLHHIPIDKASNIAVADDSPHNYPIGQDNETKAESNDFHNYPIGQVSRAQAVDIITHTNPIEQERKPQETSDDPQIAPKGQTINNQTVENNAIDPINQKHNPSSFSNQPIIFPTDKDGELEAFANLDPTDQNSTSKTTNDNPYNDQIYNKIKPQDYGVSSNNIPIDLVIEIHGNDENSYDDSQPKGHNHNELKANLKAPIEQKGETQIFGNHAYNTPIERVNLAQGLYNNQQSSLNQNSQNFVSPNAINEIMNEPWAWFSDHPGVKELRHNLNSNTRLEVNNKINTDKNVQLPLDHTNDIEHHENSDSGGSQQSLFDNVDIMNSYTPIHLVKLDKNNTIPDDKGSSVIFEQEYNKHFSKDKSSSFEMNELNDKQHSVTPPLLLSRIFDEVLHQVEKSEQDVNSKTSPLYDFNKNIDPPIISGIDATYILQKVLANQIRLWDNPEIYINQPLNGGHINRIDQHIRNDPPQISLNHDMKMNLPTDLSIEEILSLMNIEPLSDINPPLIPIDLSDGIRQSAGNTTNSNSPYLAIDYDSPARYTSFWNPQDLPFGYSSYYIIFDFKTIYTVTKMYIMNYGDMVHDVTAFKLEVWDGHGKWRMISNFFCQAGKGNHQEFGGFVGTGRYWKFTATKTASGFQPWLVELGFHGLEDYGEYLDYVDDSSLDISTELDNSSDSEDKILSDTMVGKQNREEQILSDTVVAKQNRDEPLHIPSWIYYLVGLVVLALAMLSMTCLIMHIAKKRNGLYNITLVMGKGKEDLVTSTSCHPGKDYTASAPPALPPPSAPETELGSTIDPDKNAVNSDINKVKWVFNKVKSNNKSV